MVLKSRILPPVAPMALALALTLALALALPGRLAASEAPSASVEELQLQRVLVLEAAAGITGLQPSGLAVCDGRLLMVSDRHNRQVFHLHIEADVARVAPYLTLTEIPRPDLEPYDFGSRWWSRANRRYDWEGISCDGDGRVYLLSETLAQVLVREPDGQLRWLGSESYRAGRQAGLFQHTNAFAEGLAVAGSQLLIAAERHPRGLVVMSHDSSAEQPRWRVTQALRLGGFPTPLRPKDFAGLWLQGRNLYTLERNHFQVCRRQLGRFKAERCWRYRRVERDPAYGYRDTRFGKAEGLARSGQQLYLVLDNNNDARQADADDRRPQLMVFSVPDGW